MKKKIQELEEKITLLEKRIAELESPKPNPFGDIKELLEGNKNQRESHDYYHYYPPCQLPGPALPDYHYYPLYYLAT